MRLVCLDLKVRHVVVEDENTPTVPDRRVNRKDSVSLQLARVHSVGDLGLLEDPQDQVGLIHATKG